MTMRILETELPNKLYHHLRKTANFWLFHHIPKTAGSSMASELHLLLAPYYNIHRRAEIAHLTQNEALDIDTQAFLDQYQRTRFNAASGHIRVRHVQAIRDRIPNTQVFTFLRHPVDRVISEYRYMCTDKHPTYRQHIEQYPTIDAWVDDPSTFNMMARFVAPPELLAEADGGRIVEYMKDAYTFVGLVEDYDLCFEYLTALMFAPIRPRGRQDNKTVDTAQNKVVISDELRERIAARNALDVTVYDTFATLWSDRRQRIDAFLDRQRR